MVIGGAFGAVVNSFVKDVLMPPIGLLLGGVDFGGLFIDLSGKGFATLAEAQAAGAPTLNYGVFLNTVINFVIVGFAIFIVMKAASAIQAKPKEAPAAPTAKECLYCTSTMALAATRCPHCTSQL